VGQPLESVVLGAGRMIESYEALKAMFMDARR
jgi:rod shape-determining protein MreB